MSIYTGGKQRDEEEGGVYQVANTPESVTGHICTFMIIQAKGAAKGSIQYGMRH